MYIKAKINKKKFYLIYHKKLNNLVLEKLKKLCRIKIKFINKCIY